MSSLGGGGEVEVNSFCIRMFPLFDVEESKNKQKQNKSPKVFSNLTRGRSFVHGNGQEKVSAGSVSPEELSRFAFSRTNKKRGPKLRENAYHK